MISYITGTIIHKSKQSITVLTSGGVGYDVSMTPLRVAGEVVGSAVSLFTYLKVSDSDQQLFGFGTLEEKDFFSLLMTVSGVGPKTALNILSLGSVAEIRSAIGRGDVKYLTAVSGLGTKTAERLVVELKGKIGVSAADQSDTASGMLGEVIEALMGMGYSREEAKTAIATIDSSVTTTEDALKRALKTIQNT